MVAKRTREERPKEAETREQELTEALPAAIGSQVLVALGEPGGLRRVQVRRLWEDHYRVNVFVGADGASAQVAHSFFVVADGDGQILASTPPITRQY